MLDRAQWIRTMFAEWNRILNHLMFTGSYPLELGAMTPMFYAFREREMIQDMMESATGARMHHSYCRVGGLKDDLPRGFLKRSGEVLAQMRKRIKEFETLIMGNEIIAARTKGIGVLPAQTAIHRKRTGVRLFSLEKTKRKTMRDERAARPPDLVDRNFSAAGPNGAVGRGPDACQDRGRVLLRGLSAATAVPVIP